VNRLAPAALGGRSSRAFCCVSLVDRVPDVPFERPDDPRDGEHRRPRDEIELERVADQQNGGVLSRLPQSKEREREQVRLTLARNGLPRPRRR
jgi:hypothetical protein